MKIGIYQPRASYYTGGGEVIPVQHALKLAGLGHEVTFITTRAPYIKESELFQRLKGQDNLSILYIDLPDSLKWIYDQPAGQDWRRWDLESLHVGLIAREVIARQHFDLLAVHLIFDIIAAPSHIESVMHLHGYPPTFSYHHELLATLTNNYVSVSKQIQGKWSGTLPETSKSVVVENGIDADIFRPQKAEPKYDALYIGRLLPVKGIDNLIDAIALQKHKTKVAIAGTGPIEQELHEQVLKQGLADQINFLGYVPDDDMVRLYSSAKVVVLPSKDREGILTTLLEAASCGRPVITTTAGSMSEFVKDGVNGRLVSPNDPHELAAALDELLADGRLRQHLSEEARVSIEKEWTWEVKIEILEQVYNEIIRSQRRVDG